MSYKKYQLKNQHKDNIKPFYLWKDGFINNYKKLCSNKETKPVKRNLENLLVPILVNDEIYQNQDSYTSTTLSNQVNLIIKKQQQDNSKQLNKTYHQGFFDSKTITKKNFIQGYFPKSNTNQITLQSQMDQQYGYQISDYELAVPHQNQSPLQTSLFNSKDSIKPIKNYYYDFNGIMQLHGKPKKDVGVMKNIRNNERLNNNLHFGRDRNCKVDGIDHFISGADGRGEAIDSMQSYIKNIEKYLYKQNTTKNTLKKHQGSNDGNVDKLDKIKINQTYYGSNNKEYKTLDSIDKSNVSHKYKMNKTFVNNNSKYSRLDEKSKISVNEFQDILDSQSFDNTDSFAKNFEVNKTYSHFNQTQHNNNAYQTMNPSPLLLPSTAKNTTNYQMFSKLAQLDQNPATTTYSNFNSLRKTASPNPFSNYVQNKSVITNYPLSTNSNNKAKSIKYGSISTRGQTQGLNHQDQQIQLSFNDYVSQAVNLDDSYQSQVYRSFYSQAIQRNQRAKTLNPNRQKVDLKKLQNDSMNNHLNSETTSNRINDSSLLQTPELDSQGTTPQPSNILVSDLQIKKFRLETSQILHSCFELLYKACEVNKDSLIASLFQNWFINHSQINSDQTVQDYQNGLQKSEQQQHSPSLFLNDSNQDLQIKIMKYIKQLNLRAKQTIHLSMAQDFTIIRNQMKELISDQMRASLNDRDFIMSKLFQGNIEKQSNILQQDNNPEQVIGTGIQIQGRKESSGFDITNLDFQITINKSQKKLRNINQNQIDILNVDSRLQTADKIHNNTLTQNKQVLVIQSGRYEQLYDFLYEALFGKIEIAFLHQLFGIILKLVGSNNKQGKLIYQERINLLQLIRQNLL
eukprot:403333678